VALVSREVVCKEACPDLTAEGSHSVFLPTCPTCRQDHLVGPRSVWGLHNLSPGVIVVELRCPYGHRVLEVTGHGDSHRRALSGLSEVIE
jgi:hypothetical protein